MSRYQHAKLADWVGTLLPYYRKQKTAFSARKRLVSNAVGGTAIGSSGRGVADKSGEYGQAKMKELTSNDKETWTLSTGVTRNIGEERFKLCKRVKSGTC